MKDQVPIVLLNQWLEIEPEKSHFANRNNWVVNSDEYSVYSDETTSQMISLKSVNLKEIAKRKSMLPTLDQSKEVIHSKP